MSFYLHIIFYETNFLGTVIAGNNNGLLVLSFSDIGIAVKKEWTFSKLCGSELEGASFLIYTVRVAFQPPFYVVVT